MQQIQLPALFTSIALIATMLLGIATPDAANAALRYTETFEADGVNNGTDTEGLAGASFTFTFVTNTPNYVSTGRLDIPVATAPFAEVTITGSTVGANNGTIRSSQHPVANNSPVPALAPAFGSSSLVADVAGVGDLLFELPSGDYLAVTGGFYPSIAAPSIGDPVDVADFTSSTTNLSLGFATVDSTLGFLTGYGGKNGERTIIAVPEPSAVVLTVLCTVSCVCVRRRYQQLTK